MPPKQKMAWRDCHLSSRPLAAQSWKDHNKTILDARGPSGRSKAQKPDTLAQCLRSGQ